MNHNPLRMQRVCPEYALLLEILKKGVTGGRLSRDVGLYGPCDWGKFRDLCEYHEIIPFVYSALKGYESEVPQELLLFLRNYYYRCLAWCQCLWKEFLRIEDAFRGCGIGVLPLKGVALLNDLYSSSPARTMNDIDILVSEADLSRAARVLEGLNYRQELHGLKKEYWRQRHYHMVFKRIDAPQSAVLELHWLLDYKRSGPAPLPQIWERRRFIEAQGQKVAVASAEDSFFAGALHCRRFGKVISLKNILDIVVLLTKYERTFDWDYVSQEAYRGKMRSSVYFVLCQAGMIMPDLIHGPAAERLRMPGYKKRMIGKFISAYFRRVPASGGEKGRYLFSHFLIFDGLFEPLKYIINIPHEQFCNYYGLKPYAKKSLVFYRMRFLFILFRFLSGCFSSGRRVNDK